VRGTGAAAGCSRFPGGGYSGPKAVAPAKNSAERAEKSLVGHCKRLMHILGVMMRRFKGPSSQWSSRVRMQMSALLDLRMVGL